MKLYKHNTKLFKISLFLLGIGFIFSFGISTTTAANTSSIYVNTHGNDSWDGLNSTYTSGTNGPKATIKNATGTVESNGTVHIASGTYNESNIQINTSMNIIGENQNTTIINGQQSGYSIFIIESGVNVTITNLTLTNGTSDDGGAINSIGNLKVNNCIFTNNYASNNGGAISTLGNSTINNSKFTNDQSGYGGGAIYNEGNSTVTNSIFTNNPGYYYGNIWNLGSMIVNNSVFKDTETWFGGGICSFGDITVNNSAFINNTGFGAGGGLLNQGTAIIQSSDFLNNNNANQGRGGAIFNNGGTLSVNFCRIVGNELYQIAGSTTDATLNWWGSNSDPTNNVEDGVTVGPWLVLNITTANKTVNVGGKSEVTADLLHDSDSVYHDPINGHVLDGISVNFSSDANGSVTPTSTTTTNGTANTTFTGLTKGTSTITTMVDQQTMTTTVTINKIPTSITVTPVSGLNSKTVNLTATLTDSNGNPVKDATVQFSVNGTIIGTTNTDSNGIATLPYTITQTSGTYTILANYLGNSTYDLSNNTSLLTVNKTPTTITVTPNSGSNGKTVNLTATLTDSNGNPVKDATVQFSVNGTIIGTTNTDSNGIATLPYTITQTSGTYTILANYLGNDTYAVSNKTNNLTVTPVYDLYLRITSSNKNPKVGESFKLTYKLGNYGPDNATNVTITIPLPSNFTVSNITGNGNWTFNTQNNTITWTLTNVPVGDPYLYVTGKTVKPGQYIFSSSVSPETLTLNSAAVTPILNPTTPTNPITQITPTSSITTANATTIPMQHTGLPIAGLILAILAVLGGSIIPKLKK